ncbi:hypothetical protein [Mameliella alba]|uniref:Uncharacterized protein n=1 Tax=Mameliella alba TaxID=561184 RepID=A0A0B3RGD5_9RHOB|nr:hypothetical protein [Mameliella alba]KHQ50350.1 hypothetical protein OA50_05025 [Mameliella alba]
MTPHDQWGGQQIAEHTNGTSDVGMEDLGMGEAPRDITIDGNQWSGSSSGPRPIHKVPQRLHLSALAAEVAEREAARRRRRRWAFALPILAILALTAARLTLGAP